MKGTITLLEINKFGELENLPEGFEDFFSDDLIESLAISDMRFRTDASWEADDESDN